MNLAFWKAMAAAIVNKSAGLVADITEDRRLRPLTDAQAHSLAAKLDLLRQLRGPIDDEFDGIAGGMSREAERLGAEVLTCALASCNRVFVASIASQRCCTTRHAARWIHEVGDPQGRV